MLGYTLPAMAYASIRGRRRTSGDARTASGLGRVAVIEDEYMRWDRHEPHPADAGATRQISRLRRLAGIDSPEFGAR